MPIRINLLAEAHAAEDARRRDPVKRAIQIGAALVVVILAISSSLFVKTMVIKTNVTHLQQNLNARTNDYRQIIAMQQKLLDTRMRIDALNKMAANRFLIGNLLNTLQQTTIENVYMTVFRIDQIYTLTAEVRPANPDAEGPKTFKPATAIERIVLTIGARDVGPNPGDQISKYQKALSAAPYFQTLLGANEFHLSKLDQVNTTPDGRKFLSFSLEGQPPIKVR